MSVTIKKLARMKILAYMLQGIFLLIILGAGLLFFAPSVPFLSNVELKIVKSGSMEPSIMTGSVVLVVPKETYAEGDVITFTDEKRISTTHRIVESYFEKGTTMFVTQGDANKQEDMTPIPQSSVVGSVAFSIPYVGYIIDFARQPVGFSLLIVMPALLVILGELDKIRKEIWGRRGDGRSGEKKEKKFIETAHEPQRTNASPRTLDLRSFEHAVTYAERFQHTTEYVSQRVRHYAVHTLDLRGYKLPVEKRELASRHTSLFKNWAMPLLVIMVNLAIAGANLIPYTMSYFSDTETSLGNIFQAGLFDLTPPEPFELSVTPENSCFTYVNNELDANSTYEPETTSFYDVFITNVQGDHQLCSTIGVSTETTPPVLMANFGTSSLTDSLTLRFSNMEPIKNGNRWCSADIVFSTIQEGIQYWATSTVEINDNHEHNSHSCLPTKDTPNDNVYGDKKKTEIIPNAIRAEEEPDEDTLTEEQTEELSIPENETSEENEAVEDTLQDEPKAEGENEEPEEDTQTEEDVPEMQEETTEKPEATESIGGETADEVEQTLTAVTTEFEY